MNKNAPKGDIGVNIWSQLVKLFGRMKDMAWWRKCVTSTSQALRFKKFMAFSVGRFSVSSHNLLFVD